MNLRPALSAAMLALILVSACSKGKESPPAPDAKARARALSAPGAVVLKVDGMLRGEGGKT